MRKENNVSNTNRIHRLLVTGASGFLGWNVCRVASQEYEVTGVFNTHPVDNPAVKMIQCDLSDPDAIHTLFSECAPDAVIHTAAAADPNFCQNNPEYSEQININASIAIAKECLRDSLPLAFTSSDLVFDGSSPPYKEEDPVAPLSLYGRQKVLAEQRMLAVNPRTIICRMPLMYGDAPKGMKSFIQPMITALRNGQAMKLFTDEYRTPLSAGDAARGLLLALKQTGIDTLHLGGPQRLSRYDIGMRLSESLNITGNIIPIHQKDIVMAAPRATDVSLDSTKAQSLGFVPGIIEDELLKLSCVMHIHRSSHENHSSNTENY